MAGAEDVESESERTPANVCTAVPLQRSRPLEENERSCRDFVSNFFEVKIWSVASHRPCSANSDLIHMLSCTTPAMLHGQFCHMRGSKTRSQLTFNLSLTWPLLHPLRETYPRARLVHLSTTMSGSRYRIMASPLQFIDRAFVLTNTKQTLPIY